MLLQRPPPPPPSQILPPSSPPPPPPPPPPPASSSPPSPQTSVPSAFSPSPFKISSQEMSNYPLQTIPSNYPSFSFSFSPASPSSTCSHTDDGSDAHREAHKPPDSNTLPLNQPVPVLPTDATSKPNKKRKRIFTSPADMMVQSHYQKQRREAFNARLMELANSIPSLSFTPASQISKSIVVIASYDYQVKQKQRLENCLVALGNAITERDSLYRQLVSVKGTADPTPASFSSQADKWLEMLREEMRMDQEMIEQGLRIRGMMKSDPDNTNSDPTNSRSASFSDHGASSLPTTFDNNKTRDRSVVGASSAALEPLQRRTSFSSLTESLDRATPPSADAGPKAAAGGVETKKGDAALPATAGSEELNLEEMVGSNVSVEELWSSIPLSTLVRELGDPPLAAIQNGGRDHVVENHSQSVTDSNPGKPPPANQPPPSSTLSALSSKYKVTSDLLQQRSRSMMRDFSSTSSSTSSTRSSSPSPSVSASMPSAALSVSPSSSASTASSSNSNSTVASQSNGDERKMKEGTTEEKGRDGGCSSTGSGDSGKARGDPQEQKSSTEEGRGLKLAEVSNDWMDYSFLFNGSLGTMEVDGDALVNVERLRECLKDRSKEDRSATMELCGVGFEFGMGSHHGSSGQERLDPIGVEMSPPVGTTTGVEVFDGWHNSNENPTSAATFFYEHM
ncbi:hypothetical protein IE53DRAFT_384753 [Violaceomyces palustris]|uniref:Uncharacterized protein n=1 Tax=Violaceomyces palustris TaxID=1673888 RepID=A0ACD0P3V4_9BASI|nr:hypothetical protein IE53DRAFT_384753 [Violaceomyces palustris]